MTQEETDMINMIVDLYNKYDKLEIQHSSDKEEFINALHTLQHLIMIRSVRRKYPDLFPVYNKSEINISNLNELENAISLKINESLNK